jgi:hypothetical protein
MPISGHENVLWSVLFHKNQQFTTKFSQSCGEKKPKMPGLTPAKPLKIPEIPHNRPQLQNTHKNATKPPQNLSPLHHAHWITGGT